MGPSIHHIRQRGRIHRTPLAILSQAQASHRKSPKSSVRLEFWLIVSEDEHTKDEDFEDIDYRASKSVRYDRLMSWKAGQGKAIIGTREMNSLKTDVDGNDALLPAGWRATVDTMNFKLVRKR
ncbi:hypothetical protein P154DRAFT_458805 [Amniculicola lignicola CBS 123094]|uniref:Uncharacterized protein n=1 Tax=Amniculicola lignicola CBS 123094 TaxID=1392246 RepID=A0A6A5X073_9PLEO|nr:hypothetical protein P154DRAFT_458805 [Amniculicola lignicola CBS 123094]